MSGDPLFTLVIFMKVDNISMFVLNSLTYLLTDFHEVRQYIIIF